MRTIIEYKDGRDYIVNDAAPSIDMGTMTVWCIDRESTCLTDDEPLSEIKQIIFEND